MSQVTPIFNVVLPAVTRKTTNSVEYSSIIEYLQVSGIHILYSGTDEEGNPLRPDMSIFNPSSTLADLTNLSNYGYQLVTTVPIDVTTGANQTIFLDSLVQLQSYPMVSQRSAIRAATQFEGSIPSDALPPITEFSATPFIGYEWKVYFQGDSGITSPEVRVGPDPNSMLIALPYLPGSPIRFNTVSWVNSQNIPVMFFVGRNHIINDTVTLVKWSVKIVFITSYVINTETAGLSNSTIINL